MNLPEFYILVQLYTLSKEFLVVHEEHEHAPRLLKLSPHSYVNGAAQHGTSIQRLLQDDEKVCGSFLCLVCFSDSTGEVLHGLQGAASLQSLIAAVQSDI